MNQRIYSYVAEQGNCSIHPCPCAVLVRDSIIIIGDVTTRSLAHDTWSRCPPPDFGTIIKLPYQYKGREGKLPYQYTPCPCAVQARLLTYLLHIPHAYSIFIGCVEYGSSETSWPTAAESNCESVGSHKWFAVRAGDLTPERGCTRAGGKLGKPFCARTSLKSRLCGTVHCLLYTYSPSTSYG